MNMSGIVVSVSPENIESVKASINALAGAEVHHQDSKGQLVVVQEADNIGEETQGFERIRALPNVVSANMVYHYFADDPTLELADNDSNPVPEFLNE